MRRSATRTWVVVAHRAGARILEHDGPGKGLTLLDRIDCPDGRKLEGEINTDRPGVLHGPGPGGGHPTTKRQSAHEHVAQAFALDLADRLERGRQAQRFVRLVLVAEPHFLGLLRGVLDARTAKAITATVGKDLAATRTDHLAGHLQNVLAV
jgi:protein required for attachment to host cells